MAAEVYALSARIGSGRVGCVAGHHPLGVPDAIRDWDELWAVAAVAGGQQHRQRLRAVLAAQTFMTHLAVWEKVAEGQQGPETGWAEMSRA